MALIKSEQEGGKLIAMTGDGTNDAPALAQADVGVAMNTGTTAAKEAGNMVDLDSNPTKLIDVVEIGKQLLITRGSLTTFSIANDVAKYFAIIPALFVATYPQLNTLNIMKLHSPESAVLSAVIFNALVIVALIPLQHCKRQAVLRGVVGRQSSAATYGSMEWAGSSRRSSSSSSSTSSWSPCTPTDRGHPMLTQLRRSVVFIVICTVVFGVRLRLGRHRRFAGATFKSQADGLGRSRQRLDAHRESRARSGSTAVPMTPAPTPPSSVGPTRPRAAHPPPEATIPSRPTG